MAVLLMRSGSRVAGKQVYEAGSSSFSPPCSNAPAGACDGWELLWLLPWLWHEGPFRLCSMMVARPCQLLEQAHVEASP